MMALQKRSFARQAGGSLSTTVAESTNANGEMWQTVVENTIFEPSMAYNPRPSDVMSRNLRVFGDRSAQGAMA
ncbi:hypothetical protein [Novosphingobium sp. HR1a]|uniref:hypothetical protein n=1 Tax=Novosphingobium sp. HR1a TaxID=1395637 RepID=UPI001B3C7A9D|nr:hypothetical protein [Novosphingobium sp. HR1a]